MKKQIYLSFFFPNLKYINEIGGRLQKMGKEQKGKMENL